MIRCVPAHLSATRSAHASRTQQAQAAHAASRRTVPAGLRRPPAARQARQFLGAGTGRAPRTGEDGARRSLDPGPRQGVLPAAHVHYVAPFRHRSRASDPARLAGAVQGGEPLRRLPQPGTMQTLDRLAAAQRRADDVLSQRRLVPGLGHRGSRDRGPSKGLLTPAHGDRVNALAVGLSIPQTPGAPIRTLGFARISSRGLNGPGGTTGTGPTIRASFFKRSPLTPARVGLPTAGPGA